MKAKCGAKKRKSGTCRQPAGWGTDHPGEGRCKLHGGASVRGVDHPNFKTGLYSRYLPDAIQQKVQTFLDADPLELISEMALLRALLAEYVGRFNGVTPTARDIALLADLTERVGKFSERINKMRNESALTGAEIAFLATRVADIVVKYIDDPDQQRAFVLDLVGTIGQPDTGESRPALGAGSRRAV